MQGRFQELLGCWQILSEHDRAILVNYARLLTEETLSPMLGHVLRHPEGFAHAVKRPGALAEYEAILSEFTCSVCSHATTSRRPDEA
jgi:hypothetical protein